jgi:3-hydroxyisobutyrate dehydrogenase-like beta-hydroxyacid dehydrogenase
MNTSSPDQKQRIFTLLQPTGVQFVDLAIMAPVPPKGLKTPFLASGNGASTFAQTVSFLNLNLEVLSDTVGEASTRKLLRSIVYKGLAAVIGEAVEAGQAFGLDSYMRQQISSLIGGNDALIDRFLEGSKTHALRRSHEMEAVVSMLTANAIDPIMSMATLKSLQNLQQKSL